MLGADSTFKPPSARATSILVGDASQLQNRLQKQLEEDVARIFDESIYADIEVVCGKLKILTHSCILKTRTNRFYHKLDSILHINIRRGIFDEIYSFISDIYTECNITQQEQEILGFLKSETLNSSKQNEDIDVYSTPKCTSPYKANLKESIDSSQANELAKEYALVPIENNLLEKELLEQDVLSNAFQSIISSQTKNKEKQPQKPNFLAITSKHITNPIKHSNSCDINNTVSEIDKNAQHKSFKKIKELYNQNAKNTECSEVTPRASYSPDSLIADDQSSASDYLSAAYNCSPGASCTGYIHSSLESNTKMENTFTSLDSGLENTALESLSGQKDVILTDISLTESTLHDITTDDGCNSHDSVSSLIGDCKTTSVTTLDMNQSNVTGNQKDIINSKSSKAEKQRQNEEIVILESSSLSSETGSWESVFPPKLATKDACEKFIHTERQQCTSESDPKNKELFSVPKDVSNSFTQKSSYKSSCFIDAACLVDDEDDLPKINSEKIKILDNSNHEFSLPAPSEPVPCSTNKSDLSPNNWSDNEDSLEQQASKDPDASQKDLSPTIFEMTPITEDSLCANTFEPGKSNENAQCSENEAYDVSNTPHNSIMSIKTSSLKAFKSEISDENECDLIRDNVQTCSKTAGTVFVSSTPNNSILSVNGTTLKNFDLKDNEGNPTMEGHQESIINKKSNDSCHILSGGASIEDHLPAVGSFTSSPLTRRRTENTPIVSGAYIPPPEADKPKSPRVQCTSAWIVDMSSTPKAEKNNTSGNDEIPRNKPLDKKCELLKNSDHSGNYDNTNKDKSCADSDSSEKSSHKFYIDLSSIKVPETIKLKTISRSLNEKKNMFSMYIDIRENSSLKENSAKLSTINPKKNMSMDNESYKSHVATTPPLKSINTSSDNNFSGSLCTNNGGTFEKFESLCDDPNISITEIIRLHKNSLKDNEKRKAEENHSKNLSASKSIQHNLKNIKEESTNKNGNVDALFVKLSDLDKPVPQVKESIVRSNAPVLEERMTKSIPENNWGKQNQSSSSRSNEVIRSFHSENAQSLNRLFPHLSNEFSRSMPGSLSMRTSSPRRLGTVSSPGDVDEQMSDTSEMSSIQSSFYRTTVENSTTEETSQASSIIGNCQSRLGQDLLRMFLEEIAPDVIVEVSGRRIKAHKCILSSRCQYFAGVLSGGWVESAGNVISLPPFSFNVVHFALCHIYSGVSTIPDTVSIVELATLADMLGLEGLKEAIMFTLKAKYCHHFHMPCPICIAGVLECFPLSAVYGLDELCTRCVRWISFHFAIVWASKAFATLPTELIERCFQRVVRNLTLVNCIDIACGCGILVEKLDDSRWTEIIIRLCRRLLHATANFIAPRLLPVFKDLETLPTDLPSFAVREVRKCIGIAIEVAPLDECCRAYAYVSKVVKEIRSRDPKPDLINTRNTKMFERQDNLLHQYGVGWLSACESAIVRAAPRGSTCQAYLDLPTDLRSRLAELACMMYGGPLPDSTPHDSSFSPATPTNKRTPSANRAKSKNENNLTASDLDIEHMRASFVPYAPKPPSQINVQAPKSLQDYKILCRSSPPVVKTTKAQEERAKYNMLRTNLVLARLRALNASVPPPSAARPRNVDLRPPQHNLKTDNSSKKPASKLISSSESSRNSSPVHSRNLRTKRTKSKQVNENKLQAISQDSLATSSRPRTAEPSTESLSESQASNKYATYTKTKHTAAGHVDAPKISRQPTPASDAAVNGGKAKTKIPVRTYQPSKTNQVNKKTSNGSPARNHLNRTVPSTSTASSTASSTQPRNKTPEKNNTCSLMNATKSSSAKMVTKVVKETARAKVSPKNSNSTSTVRRPQRRPQNNPVIPVMERSGTFLKDEPTFGDKTTNIDLD